jgi:hypothetical protein
MSEAGINLELTNPDAVMDAINSELTTENKTDAYTVEPKSNKNFEVEFWMIDNSNFNRTVRATNIESASAKENEIRLNEEEFIHSAEAATASESEILIEKYAQKLISLQEIKTKSVSNKANEDFLRAAEKETAIEAEQQTENYASKLISSIKNKSEK